MDAKYRFIFGLADDELGYILDDQDFGREPYEYESSMSVGSTMGSLTTNALLDLLDEWFARRQVKLNLTCIVR